MNDNDHRTCDCDYQRRDGPEQRLDLNHSPKTGAGLVSCGQGFAERAACVRVDSDDVFHEIVHSGLHDATFLGRANSERCLLPGETPHSDGEDAASDAIQKGRAGHGENAEPHNVRCTANDQKCRHGRDGQHRDPMCDVEGPSIRCAKWAEEVFGLDQSPGPNGKFHIGRTAPDRGHDCEDCNVVSAQIPQHAKLAVVSLIHPSTCPINFMV